MSLKDIEIIIEKLEKTMKNGGLGGTGSVKMDGAVLPTRDKLPKPGHNSNASKIKIPSVSQASKKNPIKSAQQIHNKDIKDIKMKEAQQELNEMVKTHPNGQWELVKTDSEDGQEAKPSFEGSYHGQSHERVTEKGHKVVRFPAKLPDGSIEMRGRKIPLKVKVKHTWDHNKKQWIHAGNEVLNAGSHSDSGGPKSMDDVAREKMEAFNKPAAESKPKTVVRKLKKSLEERLEILEKRCWKGYEPTPGKKAYDEGSCRPIKKKECECDDCECDSVEKSKYPGVYDINDNARRKANNVDAEESPIQSMKRVKKYGAGGPSKLNDTVRELKIKSKKQPVKVYTKEELDEINQKKAA